MFHNRNRLQSQNARNYISKTVQYFHEQIYKYSQTHAASDPMKHFGQMFLPVI